MPRTERAKLPADQPSRPAPARRKGAMRGALKGALITLGAILIFAVGALVAAPLFLSSDTYRAEIERKVFESTGRKLTIRGDVSVSFYPVVGLSAADVTMANRDGASRTEMATLDQLLLRVRLLPLFTGEVDVDKFILVNPVIHLEKTAAGPNWIFNSPVAGAASGKQPPDPAPKPADANPNPAGTCNSEKSTAQWLSDELGFGVKQIRFGEVGLRNGTITYEGPDGVSTEARGIDVDIALPNIQKPIRVDGSLLWNGERVSLGVEIADACKLVNGIETKGALTVATASGYLTLALDGTLQKQADLIARGKATLDVPSIRKLAAWAGSPILSGGDTFGPLAIEGDLVLEGAKGSFSNATVAFDKIRGTGKMLVDATGSLPYVNGDLAVGTLDLNPYVAGAATASPGEKAGTIDASMLQAFNADLIFRADQVVFASETVKGGVMTVRVADGQALIAISDFGLFGGRIGGTVGVDGRKAGVGLTTDLKIAGVPMRPVIRRFSGKDWLEGTGSMTAKFRGHGTTSDALARNMRGNGRFDFRNGAIRGFNAAGLFRALDDVGKSLGTLKIAEVPARLAALNKARSSSPDQKTDFSELSGNYAYAGGAVNLSGIRMLSPLLRVGGGGTAHLPKQSLDMRLQVRLVSSLKGQGGKVDLSGLEIPVRVYGPFSNIQWQPDYKAIERTYIGKALGSSLGGAAGSTGSVVKDAIRKGKDLLKGILK